MRAMPLLRHTTARRLSLLLGGAVLLGTAGHGAAQAPGPATDPQSMGSVPTRDALISGGLAVHGERAGLLSNVSITAYDHPATVALHRGGELLVCGTSQFHLLHSGSGAALLFGLDRGAFELRSASQPQDVLLTPDIRFTVESPGQFDLRVRVTREGDTCVDNAGAPGAPVLLLSDAFSSASYRLMPGQHVLFERGNLHEVVDHERSACGCPATAAPVVTASSTPAQRAEAEHPFPAAASEGLAPVQPPANSEPAGEKHTQIATTLAYGEGLGPPPSTVPSPPPTAAPAGSATGTATAGSAEPPRTPPGGHDIAHSIARFFHRLFHGKG